MQANLTTQPCRVCGGLLRDKTNRYVACVRKAGRAYAARQRERHKTAVPSSLPLCTKCGERPRTSTSGNTWCRECNAAYMRSYRIGREDTLREKCRAYRATHRERHRELNRLSDARIKAECFALYGGRCQRCEFDDPRALQIDHIDGPKDEDRRSPQRGGKRLYAAILRGDRDRSDFQLLCANCNWIKRVENNECRRKSLTDANLGNHSDSTR